MSIVYCVLEVTFRATPFHAFLVWISSTVVMKLGLIQLQAGMFYDAFSLPNPRNGTVWSISYT